MNLMHTRILGPTHLTALAAAIAIAGSLHAQVVPAVRLTTPMTPASAAPAFRRAGSTW